jgi:hypothetical protein
MVANNQKGNPSLHIKPLTMPTRAKEYTISLILFPGFSDGNIKSKLDYNSVSKIIYLPSFSYSIRENEKWRSNLREALSIFASAFAKGKFSIK